MVKSGNPKQEKIMKEKFEPTAVYETKNGEYIARYTDCAPHGAVQVTRTTNAGFAVEIAEAMNKAREKGSK